MSLENSVYLGSMDDQVTEYPWPVKTDDQYAIQQLLQNVLIGRTALVTDIHLVLNDACWTDLKKKERSALVGLIRAGALKIPKREETLSGMIEAQKSAGILSFRELPKEKIDFFHWLDEEFPSDSLGPSIASSSEIWTGYETLMKDLMQRDFEALDFDPKIVNEKDWDLIKLKYENFALQNGKGSRHEFTEAVNYVLTYKNGSSHLLRPAKQALMNIANEAYHINFAAILNRSLTSSVSVETAVGKRTMEAFEQTRTPEEVTQLKTILTIQDSGSLMDPVNVEKLFSTASRAGKIRAEFARIFSDYHAGNVEFKDLQEAAEAYQNVLNVDLVLPKSRTDMIGKPLSLIVTGTGVAVGFLTQTGPVGAVVLGGIFWYLDKTFPNFVAPKILSLFGKVPRGKRAQFSTISAPLNSDFLKRVYSTEA